MAAQHKRVILGGPLTVDLAPGTILDVEVPAKGATGHVWSVQADPGHVTVVSHTRSPSQQSFGGGGVEVFTLEPVAEGRSTITFQLGAPWRETPSEVHQLDVDVRNSR